MGYVAYLASIGYVGVIWINHQQLFTWWRPAARLEIACALPVFCGLTSKGWRTAGTREAP